MHTTSSGYEAAPSTLLLATHCACCGRPLRDAPSVERGVGPDCAAKYGYADTQGPANWGRVFELTDGFVAVAELSSWGGDARKGANVLTHRIAARPDAEEVPALIETIAALGFVKLAERLAERLVEANGLAVVEARTAPAGGVYYALTTEHLTGAQFDALLVEVRRVPGRNFDRATKENRFPAASRDALWSALRRALPGATLRTAKGESRIPRFAARGSN